MQLPADELKPVLTRLRRAHGHLASVIRMLEEGAECEDALTQLAAVDKAIARSGYSLVATGLQHCMRTEGPDNVDQAKLERLFLSLA
ncbi:MAG TPA: metal-sensitive transcriptional regulator [Gordonia sp. (in: high G+C Gram-positive bacteria)]|uniref:metal-sensitive transcriptional regulator n=1 Tax=unclassified Gordonia (in: high G+C Gram-positive bacteria) TaxID=2657482 RepID=UPI000F919525|nr:MULTISPECIES: metal-sensitive transcriptional regulator [unclassified Gordonia (in: high G+C Gram-positive bacteria)]RUP40060.1 MAG: transcriptional regulator [Gordonia sp. (in: high G+C Gram-positive bacteria)]HNP57155.1 metal-sensitive transcriptional regulator [Gordonia sp. (in: high G+C Gram-positive bacteria)]HRC50525.1 metal-sensitive transcriptional regulator [Gordonia sp. (in: high G+C Gram-positive bacteria)]